MFGRVLNRNFSGHDLREENKVSEVSNQLELNNTVGVTDVEERNYEVSSKGRIQIHILSFSSEVTIG